MTTLTFVSHSTDTNGTIIVRAPPGETVTVNWDNGTTEVQTCGSGGNDILGNPNPTDVFFFTPYTGTFGPRNIAISGNIATWIRLTMQHIHIVSPMPSLSGLLGLQYLEISDSYLTEIPNLNALTDLRTVDLSYNLLSGDTPSWPGLTKLNSLVLLGNGFDRISDLTIYPHLGQFNGAQNPLRTYLGIAIPPRMYGFTLYQTALDEEAVDQIGVMLHANNSDRIVLTTRNIATTVNVLRSGSLKYGGITGAGYLYDSSCNHSTHATMAACEVHVGAPEWYHYLTDGWTFPVSEIVELAGAELPDPLDYGRWYNVLATNSFTTTAQVIIGSPFPGPNSSYPSLFDDEYPQWMPTGTFKLWNEKWTVVEKIDATHYRVHRIQNPSVGQPPLSSQWADLPIGTQVAFSTSGGQDAKKRPFIDLTGGDDDPPSSYGIAEYTAARVSGESWSQVFNDTVQDTGLPRLSWQIFADGSHGSTDFGTRQNITGSGVTRLLYSGGPVSGAALHQTILMYVFYTGETDGLTHVSTAKCAGEFMKPIGGPVHDIVSGLSMEAFYLCSPKNWNLITEVVFTAAVSHAAMAFTVVRDAADALIVTQERQDIVEARIGKADWAMYSATDDLIIVAGAALGTTNTTGMSSPNLTLLPSSRSIGFGSGMGAVVQAGYRQGTGNGTLPAYITWTTSNYGVARLFMFQSKSRYPLDTRAANSADKLYGSLDATSVTLLRRSAGSTFPDAVTGSGRRPFYAWLDEEMIQVLNIQLSTPSIGYERWTVVRGVRGTVPRFHHHRTRIRHDILSTLTAGVGALSTDTAITILDGEILPASGVRALRIGDEYVLVTSRSDGALTVVRGIWNTAIVEHRPGDSASLVPLPYALGPTPSATDASVGQAAPYYPRWSYPKALTVTQPFGVQRVALGTDHMLVLGLDGCVYAAMKNGSGQLGQGDTTTRPTLTRVDNAGTLTVDGADILPDYGSIVDVWAGDRYSLAVDNVGGLWAWGLQTAAAFGPVLTDPSYPDPQELDVPSGGVIIKAVGATGEIIALDDAGALWHRGSNADGQLGDGTSDTSDHDTWTQIAPGSLDFVLDVTVSLHVDDDGSLHSVIACVTSAGVYAWGRNANDFIGSGDTSGYVLVPTVVTTHDDILTTLALLSSDATERAYVDQTNTLYVAGIDATAPYAIGANDRGQFGDPSDNNQVVRTLSILPLENRVGTMSTDSLTARGIFIRTIFPGLLWSAGYNKYGDLNWRSQGYKYPPPTLGEPAPVAPPVWPTPDEWQPAYLAVVPYASWAAVQAADRGTVLWGVALVVPAGGAHKVRSFLID